MNMFKIAAFAIAFTGCAIAADADTTKPVPTSNEAEQKGAPVGSPVQTSGKVVNIHSLMLVGVAVPHTVVKIETSEGDTDIVDLGSTEELKSNGIEPRQGQTIWVDGRVGQINDKFLIVADRLSETKLVTIARTAPLREQTTRNAAREGVKEVNTIKDNNGGNKVTANSDQEVKTVEGTVILTCRMKIEGQEEDHFLAKIQTDFGIAVVDLGKCNEIPNNVNYTEGKTIAASGFVGQLNGKPIILADSVGNMTPIKRPADVTAVPIK